MEYSFKQMKLADAEMLWLSEIRKLNFSKVDVKSLRARLWRRLPKDFRADAIDSRLIRDNHLTLIGLWYVEPDSPIFGHVSKAIEITRELILKGRALKSIKASEIAVLAGMTEREAEIALMFVFELDGFFGSAGGPSSLYGAKEAGFREDERAYDEFLRFENLQDKMEEFFIRHEPAAVKKKGLAVTQFLQDSDALRGARSSRDTWSDIENDFGISKRTFAKKIKFVRVNLKRKIIFRDVEHAYILANNGFSKPAVILAGGVIEELLRLYLEHKKITPKSNNFADYIRACERERLLKSGISKMSDVVREFRNLVHLSVEETKKHTITKATAKGAVAFIFTIANDF